MKIRIILFIILGLGITFVGYWMYSIIYGSPIAKYKFKNEVESYLKSEFNESMVVESIAYSFKESTSSNSHFIAVVYSENNPSDTFRIDKGYNGHFIVYKAQNRK